MRKSQFLIVTVLIVAGTGHAAVLEGTFSGTLVSETYGYPDFYASPLDRITGTIHLDTDLLRLATADLEPDSGVADWSASGDWLHIRFTVDTGLGPRSFGGDVRSESNYLQLWNDDVFPPEPPDDYSMSDDYFLTSSGDDMPWSAPETGVFESYSIRLESHEFASLPLIASMLSSDNPDQEIDWQRTEYGNPVYRYGHGTFWVGRRAVQCLPEPIFENIYCYDDPHYASGSFVLDSLRLAVIPIPAAVWLLGSALGVLGYLRRRVLSN